MKTIGIVGGIAWPSSIVYYRIINELVAQRLGDNGLHSASLVLAQTDFEQIERNQRAGRWDLVGDLLAQQGNKLKAAGADFFPLACNTVHTTADRIQSAVDLPFLHIVDPTAHEVQQPRGHDRRAARQSVHDDRQLLRRPSAGALRDERLGRRRRTPGERAPRSVRRACQGHISAGNAGEVQGCDHRSRPARRAGRHPRMHRVRHALKARDSPLPLIDTTLTHAQAAVEIALQE
jgi:aspartate racemase